MPPTSFSPRKRPQRSPEAMPPGLSSAAALLDGLFEHPAEKSLYVALVIRRAQMGTNQATP